MCDSPTTLQSALLEPPATDLKVGTRSTMWTPGRLVLASIMVLVILGVALEVAGDWVVNQPTRTANAVVGWIALAILVTALLVGAAIIALRLYTRRRDVPRVLSAARVADAVFEPADGATEIVGVARAHRQTVAAHDGGARCLASVVRARRGARLVVWHRASVEFLVERDGDTPVLVTGELVLDGPAAIVRPPDERDVRARLPVHAAWSLDATLETRRLDEGTRVRAIGVLTRKTRPELVSSYRDAMVDALEGRPGLVVRLTPIDG